MLREEYRYLLPDDPDVSVVADCAFTFEEFIAKLADEGNLKVKFTDESREILLHGAALSIWTAIFLSL